MTTKTLYRSKYALSEGKINAAKYEVSSDGDWRRIGGPYYEYYLKLGRDVHETAEGAIKAAEAARAKRIASLEKQITKLKALQFTVDHGEAA